AVTILAIKNEYAMTDLSAEHARDVVRNRGITGDGAPQVALQQPVPAICTLLQPLCRTGTAAADTLHMNPAVSQSRAIAPVAFEDGLGERLYAVGAANEPLEVLKVSNELSCVSIFEDALREQAARVADFRHEAFGRVRAVERLDARSSAIVIISDHVRGVRLSDVL